VSDVTVNLSSNPVSVNFGNFDTVSGASALTTANRLVKVSGSGGVTMATIAESGITGVLTLTKTGSTARTATFPDAAIEVQAADEEKSADFTARLHATYLVTATCTVTDPTPAQGHEYIVFVRNGTCTIGGVGYIAGQTIKRSYHSGAWSSTVLAALGVAQTFSALNTFTAGVTVSGAAIDHTHSTGITTRAAATQDAIALAGRAGGTSSYVGTLTPTTLTASRTWTFPDAAITVAGSASALTSGRVPFATTGGLLTDATSLLFNSSTQVFTVGSGSGAVTASLNVNGAAGQTRQWAFQSGGVDRWHMRCDSTAEGGSDAGSNFVLSARTDAGALIDFPLSIARAAGGVLTLARPVTSTGVITVPNGTAAAPGLRMTSEASGLYRIGATSIGVSVAGSLVLTVGSTASSFASGTTLAVSNTTASTSTTTGALTVAGGISAQKEVVSGLGFWCVDGQTAPSATAGYAKIYVDTADGDLKIIFGDGTIKTIVTDT